MITALCWIIKQQVVVIPYRRRGTQYRSHFQGSIIKKMGDRGCLETSVRNYHFSPCVTTRKRAGLSYLTAEAGNHAQYTG